MSVAEAQGVHVEQWGRLGYGNAMDRLAKAHAGRIAGTQGDQVFYLEHEPVVTYGRATSPEDIAGVPADVPLIEVARGGLATYHGPGQLVGYLVINLADRANDQRPDIHAYLRALEEGLIEYLQHQFGLPCCRREGFTGVWTQGFAHEPDMPRKLASIGISARRWVTSHGFALNIDPDMTTFRSIVPCGITDAEMTSVALEFERAGKPAPQVAINEVASQLHPFIVRALNRQG